jgi:RNA polymerase sigma-70 factor (ECF subfamily)
MAERPVEPDASVVDRARHGDEAAFAELVQAHQHEVFTLTLRLLGNYELAADAAQETFIRAWRALPRFRGDAALSTWLHRIAVNTSWTVRRSATRHRAAPLDDQIIRQGSAEMGPDELAENSDLGSRLSRVITDLPLQQRAVVVMKDIYGWSHAEVAEALNISVTAAKVRLHRARKQLKDRLWGEQV